MKIRNGFVSNSSSSSFVVTIKDDKYTKEDIEKNNRKLIHDYCDYDECDLVDRLKDYKDQYILYYGSVDYGAEECVEQAIKGVLKGLGIEKKVNVIIES